MLYELVENSLFEAAKSTVSSQSGARPSGSQPGEVNEPQREVFGKVMCNLVASAELVFYITREQR